MEVQCELIYQALLRKRDLGALTKQLLGSVCETNVEEAQLLKLHDAHED